LPNHKNRKLQLIKINQWGVSLYTPQEEKNKMKLEQAKNIINYSSFNTQQAVKKLMEVQFEIFYNDFKRQLEEKQSQYDALRKMRNDFLDVENWEQLQEKIKEWNI